MRRRYHKRRWTLVCFFTVMLILPAAAVIPKSGGRSSAYPYAKETGTSLSLIHISEPTRP